MRLKTTDTLPQGLSTVKFQGHLLNQITTVPRLCGTVNVILSLAVLVEHRLVTDGHRAIAYTGLAQRRVVITAKLSVTQYTANHIKLGPFNSTAHLKTLLQFICTKLRTLNSTNSTDAI